MLYIDVDAAEEFVTSCLNQTDPESREAQDRDEKRPRRKKRERTQMEGEIQSSAGQTREQSFEDGEIDPLHDSQSRPIENSSLDEDRRSHEIARHRRSLCPFGQKPASPNVVKDIFFFDLEPAILPSVAVFATARNPIPEEKSEKTLLLPAHVSLFGTEPVVILPPTTNSGEESYIDYLDLDDRIKHAARYFEESAAESTKPKRCECPTLWRLYDYLDEEGKNLSLKIRKQKRNLSIGQGGEGYIARDKWCYNCGSAGHWGDDCHDMPHHEDFPNEPSAFSEHNTLSGPFYDTYASNLYDRKPRDWELLVPENVGKKGRKDQLLRMERKAREQVSREDTNDWFENPKNTRTRRVPQPNVRTPEPPKKLTFGKSIHESVRHLGRQSRPSLLERLGNTYLSSESQSKPQISSRPQSLRKPDHGYHSHSSRYDRSHRNSDHKADWRGREDPGPRYRGRYSR
ncbi:hypothetical protein H0H81_003271 [Sphagnurus paluster]|uniref:CCHC-type domain-containing protein n=1 Tax=Sphagnurus paluster TaxID=117069 RepID=A0A9P7K6C8_9AGAR|nr:hypothetical protein H0H81_003271 [Sphagnurus paluster]